MERLPTARMIAIALAMLACALMPATARAQTYAPLNQPGPPLSIPLAKLQASLECQPSVREASVEPVLLNPATGVTPEENYSWNWEPALDKLGIPWCAYTSPNHTLNDIQTSGEYLVYAIRTMYALAHRKIAIIGHSQGGMSMRWPLRFWPDTRVMVDKVIGFSGTNHGTTQFSSAFCASGCPPAAWQQAYQSNFVRALNSHAETFAGISYTEIYSRTDNVVTPNSGPNASAAVHTGRGQIADVATQQVCPGDTANHLAIGTVDPVAYALAVDALTHPGPARPARIPKSVCSQQFMPGVSPGNLNENLQLLASVPGYLAVKSGGLSPLVAGAPAVTSEPPLGCYVFAACTGAAAPTLTLAYRRHGRRLTVLVRTLEGNELVPVPGVRVQLGRRHALTGAHGRATLMIRARRRYRVIATRPGCNPAVGTL